MCYGMVKIENEQLAVTISEKGAELQSIWHKGESFDYLWQGAEGYWSKHAPNLFPIVGRLNDNKHVKDGQVYEMNQHGFARDMDFETGEHTGNEATFVLRSNEETRSRYPFEFILTIRYRLDGNKLEVVYRVENQSDERMPYSLGGHPAFNLPINGEGAYEDYRLTFKPQVEGLAYFEMDPPPFMSGQKRTLEAFRKGRIKVDRSLFGAGMVIDLVGDVKQATLSAPDAKHGVTIHVGDFPYLCLWTEEGVEAPFLCVEPFHGMADIAGEPGDLTNKRGINLLAPGDKREHSFTIELF